MSRAPTTFSSTGASTDRSDEWEIDIGATRSDLWQRLPWYLPALIAMWLGFVFLQPNDTFARSDNWKIMAGTFGQQSESVWGIILLLTGTLHVALKAARRPERKYTALAISALLGFIGASLTFSAGILSTGTGSYVGYALLAVWAARRPPR